MKDVEYAYAVAYIKTLENKMLTRSDMESLITASDYSEALKLLHDRGWSGDSSAEMLKNELAKAWSVAYEVCPEEAPIDILLLENDFHNLKTILKAYVANVDWSNMMLSPSIVDSEVLANAIKKKDYSELPVHIADACKKGYELLTATMDGQLVEIYIDKCYFEAVSDFAEKSKDEFLIGWASLICELADLKTALRCAVSNKSKDFTQNALINPNEALIDSYENIQAYIISKYPTADLSSLSAFEKWCDNQKLAYTKSAKASCFGFAPIVAFLIGTSFEVQAVRIILACKENGWSKDIIHERLRDTYV